MESLMMTKIMNRKRSSSSRSRAINTQAIRRAHIAVKAARKSKIQVNDMLLDRRSKAMSRKTMMNKLTRVTMMATLNLI
jgi:hypothetical protein